MDLSEAAYARQGCGGQGESDFCTFRDDGDTGSSTCSINNGESCSSQSCFAPMFAAAAGGSENDNLGQSIVEWSQSHLLNLWKTETTANSSGSSGGTTAAPAALGKREEEEQVKLQLDGQEAAVTVGLVGDGDGDIDVIAKAMSQLSFDQREQAYNDIHGVSATNERDREDPNAIEKSLKAVRKQLQSYIQDGQQQQQDNQRQHQQLGGGFSASLPPTLALRIAMEQDKNYVMDDSFLLMFLRAKEYDTTVTAQTILHFFQHKMSLFGRDKLTRDITLDDLDSDDYDTLVNGGLQHVPLQDQSGRHIVVGVPGLEKWKVHENMLKTVYYILMSLIKNNTDAQRRGIIAIHMFSENLTTDNSAYPPITKAPSESQCSDDHPPKLTKHMKSSDYRQMRRKVLQLRNSLPMKVNAVHLCTDDPQTKLLIKLVLPFFNMRTLTRSRIEYGNHLEIQYKLLSYGIPLAALPIDTNGCVNNEFHKIWLQQRRLFEESELRKKENASRTITAIGATTTSANGIGAETAGTVSNTPSNGVVATQAQIQMPVVQAPSPYHVTSGLPVPKVGKSITTQPSQTIQPQITPTEPIFDIPNASAYPPAIFQIGPDDVLLGRGRAIDQHYGNVQFRRYLQQDLFMKQYQQTKKRMKAQLASMIRKNLQENFNVRFLIQHDTGRGWQLADDTAVDEKISRTFRRLLLHTNK